MNGDQGIATGVLLVILGTWVVARTFIHDQQGNNLVDRLVHLAGGGTGSGANPITGALGLFGIGPGVTPAGNPTPGKGDVPTTASMQSPPRFLASGQRNPAFMTWLRQHHWINPRTGQRDPWAP